MAENKGVAFTATIPGDALVTADGNMMATVVRNLLTNAVKYTPAGGTVALTVTPVAYNVTTTDDTSPASASGNEHEHSRRYVITVSDTGTGMSREQISNLFRLDSSRSQPGTAGEPGTGLGLIVCRDLLDKHGATLHIESEPGKGSRFWFELSLW
jgi:signal transduction histidine kinase